VSGEIELTQLIKRLMVVALENAGADRGLLILPRDDGYLVEAVAEVSGGEIVVRQETPLGRAGPDSLIRYVIRTRESVILDDAAKPGPFADDEYLLRRLPRSVFCLPLVRQAAVAGVLYLENTQASHVFTPARTALLGLLASQLAISLENTRLYRDLKEREARVRRLVDSNIIGIFIWDVEGRITESNDSFLQMLDYERADLLAGSMRWTELTPAEWREADARRLAEVKVTGATLPYEKEFCKKDGTRVPVLIGAAIFDGARDEGVAFVLDLTDRKRSEEAVRESEKRYREVQLELAHSSRVAIMGQLTASIAHEVNQPIASVIINAATAQRRLEQEPPNIEGARQAVDRLVKNGNVCASRSRTNLRGVLHDEVDRAGDGAVDLPLDRRGAWRAIIGRRKRAERCSFSIHGADPSGARLKRRSRPAGELGHTASSAPIPKFASFCGTFVCELRNRRALATL
jgi:PAS domain S-box-containing protein